MLLEQPSPPNHFSGQATLIGLFKDIWIFFSQDMWVFLSLTEFVFNSDFHALNADHCEYVSHDP